MASQATTVDAGKGGGVAPGRGDLRLRGCERIMSKCCGGLGRRRERAVRQVVLGAAAAENSTMCWKKKCAQRSVGEMLLLCCAG